VRLVFVYLQDALNEGSRPFAWLFSRLPALITGESPKMILESFHTADEMPLSVAKHAPCPSHRLMTRVQTQPALITPGNNVRRPTSCSTDPQPAAVRQSTPRIRALADTAHVSCTRYPSAPESEWGAGRRRRGKCFRPGGVMPASYMMTQPHEVHVRGSMSPWAIPTQAHAWLAMLIVTTV
jgi:hypothetical protein